MAIAIREASPELGAGEAGRVLLFVYAGAIEARSNEVIRQAVEDFEKAHGAPGGILVVINPKTQAPTDAAKQGIVEQVKAAAAKGWKITLLAQFESRFAMVAVKSVLAAICFVSVINVKATSSIDEAAADLASGLKPPPGADFAATLAEALRELRSRMGQ